MYESVTSSSPIDHQKFDYNYNHNHNHNYKYRHDLVAGDGRVGDEQLVDRAPGEPAEVREREDGRREGAACAAAAAAVTADERERERAR